MSQIQTYTFWQLVNQYAIIIPIVQRDYAQGRVNQESQEIRDKFLEDLQKCLATDKPIELDFVFGKIKDDTFIPIDGQQRLTTLFLLHWYISIRTDDIAIKESFKQITFSYKTRISSKDFTGKLVLSSIQFDELQQDFLDFLKTIKDLKEEDKSSYYVSFCIKNTSWFFRSWQKDPTVQAMLTMLDAIHVKFKTTANFKLLWDKLTAPNYTLPINNPKLNELVEVIENDGTINPDIKYLLKQVKLEPVISFKLLNLEDFQLTDELYLKMNARGRPLNKLENFKAWLIGYVEENDIKVTDDEWKTKFDKEWTDLFWRHKDDNFKIAGKFMRFINGILMYGLATKGNRENILFFVKEKKIALSKYETLKCFNGKEIDLIANVLDWLYSHEDNLGKYITGLQFWQEKLTFVEFLDENISYASRALFYANVLFISNTIEHDDFPEAAYFKWIRVARNLISHSTIDSAETFITAINGINEIGTNCQEIYYFLANPDNKVTGFLSAQITEERIKSKLVILDQNWENELIDAENHQLFRGSIDFLLPDKENEDINAFKIRRGIAKMLFVSDGSSPDLKKDYILIRATLALSSVSDNIKLKDDGNNWRDLLKNKQFQDALIILIDSLKPSNEDEYGSKLNQFINDFNEKSILWKYALIKNKILLSGTLNGINVSKSNILQHKYDQKLYYLFNNEGGNWINNDNQILLSNLRNQIITRLLSADDELKPDRKDLWWLFSDKSTNETFYRGEHIWIRKKVNVNGMVYTMRYQFQPRQLILGIHNDPEENVGIIDNDFEIHNSWKICKRLSYDMLTTETEIEEYIKQVRILAAEIKNHII